MRGTRFAMGSFGALLASAAFVLPHAEADPGPTGPAERPEPPLVALGRRLFQDPTISRSGRHACASCHDPEHGWSDPRTFSPDVDGPTLRHSQPVTDLVGSGFHWDGEFPGTRDLVQARAGDRTAPPSAASTGVYYGPAGPVVTALDPLPVSTRLASDARYETSFAAAFGDGRVTSERIVDAVDAFVGSLRTGENALDRYLGGEKNALTDEEIRGLQLFRGRAACAKCHLLRLDATGRAVLTDRQYHNTGVATAQQKRAAAALAEVARSTPAALPVQAPVVPTPASLAAAFTPDLGRMRSTQQGADVGRFKTPSLRDVARRAPYMHDGSLRTLEEVIRYYSAGGTPNDNLDPAIHKLVLGDAEVRVLAGFLRTMTSDARPGALPARSSPQRLVVSVVDLNGAPLPRFDFRAVPFGERLGDACSWPASVTTSDEGVAAFDFPQTTHVVLRSATHELAEGRPIPDGAGLVEAVAAPLDRIAVRLRGTNLPDRLDGRVLPAGTTFIAPRPDGGMNDLRLPPEDPALPFEREAFGFEKVRAVSPDEAIYTAPIGRTRGVQHLEFRVVHGPTRVAVIDLDGGWSESAQLRTLGPAPPTPPAPKPNPAPTGLSTND